MDFFKDFNGTLMIRLKVIKIKNVKDRFAKGGVSVMPIVRVGSSILDKNRRIVPA